MSSSDFNVLFCFFTFITHFKPQQPAFFSGEDLNTRVQYLLSTKQQADTTGDELMKWELLETKIALITSLPQLYFTLFFPNFCIIYVFHIRINLLYLVRSDFLEVSAVLLRSSAPWMVVFPEWQSHSFDCVFICIMSKFGRNVDPKKMWFIVTAVSSIWVTRRSKGNDPVTYTIN